MVALEWRACPRPATHDIIVNGVPQRILCEGHHWLVSGDRDSYDVHPHVVVSKVSA